MPFLQFKDGLVRASLAREELRRDHFGHTDVEAEVLSQAVLLNAFHESRDCEGNSHGVIGRQVIEDWIIEGTRCSIRQLGFTSCSVGRRVVIPCISVMRAS